MILKNEFNATVDRLGLSEEVDQCLAEIIWERCEAAHANKSSQVAALLKTKKERIKREGLSQSEIQFITGMIARTQNLSQDFFHSINNDIQGAWLLCDPDDETTQENFEILNSLKNIKRKAKEEYKKLANVQHKLKKMR